MSGARQLARTRHGTRAAFAQVIPGARGGVADHAENLRCALLRLGVAADTLVLRPNQNLTELVSEASTEFVLVHVSIYGYARRGLCWWLVEELEHLRSIQPSVRVGSLFHELYANGPPWSAAFWTEPLQRTILRRLALASDLLVTSTRTYQHRLQAMARDREVLQIPVFSNVGEPISRVVFRQRCDRLVLFGSASTRASASAEAKRIAAALSVPVVEVGPGPAVATEGRDWSFAGFRAPSEVSALLASSKYGACAANSKFFCKSGVFAALASHGCVPIGRPSPLERELVPGQHYLSSLEDLRRTTADDCEAISKNLFEWYQPHSLSAQARAFADLAHVSGSATDVAERP